MNIKEQIASLDKIYKLKETDRLSHVKGRMESTAEHSWGVLMVADFFFPHLESRLDKKHVYDLLMYHDLVEAECGDMSASPDTDRSKKEEIEAQAVKILANKLPKHMGKKLLAMFDEYEKQHTLEAQFAKICDGFESDTFIRKSDLDWSSWTTDFYDNLRRPHYENFPELLPYLDELQSQLIEQGILK
jgi:putative hydrolase of HD superfamily